jgi:putative tricarboxylic transport membrane protein
MVQGVKSDIGSLHSPGPGFVPFWSAVVLGVLSIILGVSANMKKKGKEKLIDLWKGLEWSKVLLVLFALFVYPVLLPQLGYLIATFALIIFLLCIGARSKLWVDIASALAITVVSYVIFYSLLDVKLPKGMLGL